MSRLESIFRWITFLMTRDEYWHAVWLPSLKCMFIQSKEWKCNWKVTVTISLPNLFWSRAWCNVASLLQGQSPVSLISRSPSWHLLCCNICNASHAGLDNDAEMMTFFGCIIKGLDNEPDLFWHFTNWLCIRVCSLCRPSPCSWKLRKTRSIVPPR